MKHILLIDFDSTIVRVESLDLLSASALANHPNGEILAAEIAEITRMGMEGEIDFRQSLERRLAKLEASKAHVNHVVGDLKKAITRSFLAHKDQLQAAKDRIYVITGGFHDLVDPVIEHLGLRLDHVYANDFIYDANGRIAGFDPDNPLSKPGGKAEIARLLSKEHPAIIVGDGYTDYQVREQGAAEKFYYFAEVVKRSPVMALADKVVYGIDAVLDEFNLPTRYSFPRSKMRVLLLDDIEPAATDRLTAEGYRVDWTNEKFDEDRLMRELEDVSVLGIRTRTKLTAPILAAAKKLLAVGVFAVGLDHVDSAHAASQGVSVFNAPYSNTRSVVELAIAEIIGLLRHLPIHNRNMHAGQWVKFAKGSYEVRGKTLGIVGYGNIGSQLSVLAEAMGMDVIYYDVSEKLPMGKAQKVTSLGELLSRSDVVTVHTDGRASNKGMFGAAEFAAMKDGGIFLNLSRGGIADLDALKQAVLTKKLSGCGIDVFPTEPKTAQAEFASALQGLDNVIITPHIGGSTEEAQRNIALYVSDLLVKFLATGETMGSVSLPELHCPPLQGGTRILHTHGNMPGLVAKVSSILANHGVNIVAQNLGTRDQVGYLVTDIASDLPEEMIKELWSVPDTIRVRVVNP